jgi:transglutaminase-like putative cysteine protease
MRIRVGCEFQYQVPAPTSAVWQVQPRDDGPPRLVTEAWSTDPPMSFHEYRDLYNNICRRLTIPSGHAVIRYDALVEVPPEGDEISRLAREIPVEELPDETLIFTLPSRYCLSDVLSSTAWELFGATEPGWPRVQAICDWVHENIQFAYGSSTPLTTAADVYEKRTGVCRDFAHLGVSFCRALNIPARYAFGYLPDIGVPPPDLPMDFCAWFEAYLGGRWYTFDPRNNQHRIGRALIGLGRDALDVAMVTTYGAAQLLEMTVWADDARAATVALGAHGHALGAGTPPPVAEEDADGVQAA